MSLRRALPSGIRGRGLVFTCTWRDATGQQFSRKAGDTLVEAEAFKRRIEEKLTHHARWDFRWHQRGPRLGH